MEDEEFRASEVIAGFPLVTIKRALSHVGLGDHRDDIKIIADALHCPSRQAEGVLEALERRGFVTKTGSKKRWDLTPLGNRLRFQWKPPRRIEPVIERDDDDSDAINEEFESVPCSIFRANSDDSASFEEAQIGVGILVEYESNRVIELCVAQPDFYDDPDASSTIETSVYLGVAEAKKLAEGLQVAIRRAEAEIARRATAKPRKQKRTKPARVRDDRHEGATTKVKSSPANMATRSKLSSSEARTAVARAVATAEKKEQARKNRESEALASTLAELRGTR